MKIRDYKVDSDGWCQDPCPFGMRTSKGFRIRVGSTACSMCQFNQGSGDDFVDCADDKKAGQ